MSVDRFQRVVLEVLAVQLTENVADLTMDYPYQPDTKRERCAANPNHYPCLQRLMKTRQTTYFHTRQNWTIMVCINYRIVQQAARLYIPHFSLSQSSITVP